MIQFKKDYINYLLYNVVHNGRAANDIYPKLSDLLNRIIAADDLVRITYILGKTDGMEDLFKYFLYISDKIDKSQLSVFNLKDNYDYDTQNLRKICAKLEEKLILEKDNVKISDTEIAEEEKKLKPADTIKIPVVEKVVTETASEEIPEIEEDSEESDAPMSLLENKESVPENEEVFGLDEITQSVQTTTDNIEETKDEVESKSEETDEEESEEDIPEEIIPESKITDEVPETETDEIVTEEILAKIQKETEEKEKDEVVEEKLPDLEFEINSRYKEGEHSQDESVANEAYYKFETKFFEDVKILEKLFSNVGKEYAGETIEKLNEKTLQSLTQIIEITTELGNSSRQLQLDLTADIFQTINLYFTKVIAYPNIITGERLKLMDASLSLVNSLIKGEDYLDYNIIVDKIEQLKEDMQRPVETRREENIKEDKFEEFRQEEKLPEPQVEYQEEVIEQPSLMQEQDSQRTSSKTIDPDSVIFKLKYLVKEFERNFIALQQYQGEYSKFEALDAVDLLNNSLRLIAKISAAARMPEVCKLSEVSYIFLKYVKDYRIDLLDPEIQQIVKYIIFTFKMLLTGRYPEDFKKLVQYLNDPVKIFTDQ